MYNVSFLWKKHQHGTFMHVQHICHVIIHSCKWITFLNFFFLSRFFYVTSLSFIGPAGQLDSCVSCTKETKWSWGQAVMSNSSYSVTYRPAAVFGSLMETMDGFERSGALWSPSLIEFPGSRLQRWGWLWSGICRSRKGRTVGAWGPSSVLTFYKQVGWSGRGWQWRRRSGRSLLWRSVNAEVALNNNTHCLIPPAADFLTAYFSHF